MINLKETKALKDYDSVSLASMLRDHFVENYPYRTVQRLENAIQVASYLHRYDVRRGTRGKLPNPPYIEHPLRVALRLVRFGIKNPDLIIAAILHDTVEDHPFEFADFEGVMTVSEGEEEAARRQAHGFVSNHFGFFAARIVAEVSNPILPADISKQEKINKYQAHVKAVLSYSYEALLLKVSDFIDNAGSLHHHYEYNDKSAQYFIDRYSPLLPIYMEAVTNSFEISDSIKESILSRLEQVSEQFERFHGVRK